MADDTTGGARQAGAPDPTPDGPIALRHATKADLEACARIHHAAIEAYLTPLGVDIGPFEPDLMVEFFAHLLATDPDRFLVAAREGGDLIGFASANVRGGTWFLAMLFVLPESQGRGLGTRLLEAVLPGPEERAPDGERLAMAVATDSMQPISNALYARYGMVPRLPAYHLKGPVVRPEAFGSLPAGAVAIAIGVGGDGGAGLTVDPRAVLDIELLGYLRPQDHRWLEEHRRGWAFVDADGGPLGYGYLRSDGRIAPVAALDPSHVPAIVGHIVREAARPDATYSLIVPGAAGELFMACLASGMRIGDAPMLLGWDRPIADLSRYVPIGMALI